MSFSKGLEMLEIFVLGMFVRAVVYYSHHSKGASLQEEYLLPLITDALQWPVYVYKVVKNGRH